MVINIFIISLLLPAVILFLFVLLKEILVQPLQTMKLDLIDFVLILQVYINPDYICQFPYKDLHIPICRQNITPYKNIQ